MDIQDILSSVNTRLTMLEARRQQERVFTLELPNGEKVTAPVGLWFMALTTTLDSKAKAKMIEAMTNIQNEHIAKNSIINSTVSTVGAEGSKGVMVGSPTSENPTGRVAHTDFTVDDAGKKHYKMHCDPGNYAGSFGRAKLTLTDKKGRGR